MEKKSTYRTLAEALTFEQLGDLDLPLGHLDSRKLSVNEIKVKIKEAFEDAKDACDVKAKELAGGWGDADLEKEMNWVKTLKLKEFFEVEAVKESSEDKGDEEKEEESEE